ncbi:MAG: hypothetical protein LBH82_02540 [Bacteroidales bacterium]|jgi:hypothetical protein|nr:hypothetical protein [Bacteroidales bacterium]
MKKTVRIIGVFVFLSIVGTLSFVLYRSYHYLESDQYFAENVIPADALFILKSKQTQQMLENRSGSLLFSPKNWDKVHLLAEKINQSDFKSLLNHSSLCLSVHAGNEEELLFVLETSKAENKSLSLFGKYLRGKYAAKTFDYKNHTIDVLDIKGNLFYSWTQQGVFLMASSEGLMRSAVNQFHENKTVSSVVDFSFHAKNKNTNLSLYIQYPYFLPYLRKKIRQADGDVGVIALLEPNLWSVFDVEMKNECILLSGYTTINPQSQYATLYFHANNNTDFQKMLPLTANRIFSFSAENAEQMSRLQAVFRSEEDFFSLMYPTQVITFEATNDTANYTYLMLHSDNVEEASFHLYQSLESSFDSNQYLLDVSYIGSFMVGHIRLSNFVLAKFGINRQLTNPAYYTLHKDYIVFSDNKDAICYYINSMRQHDVYTKSSAYKALKAFSSNKSNLFYRIDFDIFPHNQKAMPVNGLLFQTYPQSDSVCLTNIVIR